MDVSIFKIQNEKNDVGFEKNFVLQEGKKRCTGANYSGPLWEKSHQTEVVMESSRRGCTHIKLEVTVPGSN
jgi:hypothetical protein